jgi:outer membrane protein OmpU
MKKILLATTMLTLTAGAALADAHMTWGASAAAGIASQAGGNFETYSSANLALTLAGQTDGGLTFGASFDVTAGRSYTLGDGDDFATESGAFGMPTIFVAGSFGKLEISDDNFDFFDDTNGGGDAKYTGTFGAVAVGLVADVDSNNASLSLGYSAGNLALSANVDTYDLSNVSATYTMGTIAITAATDESSNSSIKLAYTGANGMSGSAQYNTSDESIDIAAGYSANGLSVNADTNTVSNAWTVTGSYDLGGGLTVEVGTNYTQDMMIGAAMAF